MIKRIMRRIRHELTTPPEKLFPLRPALPVPHGISEKELFEFVTTVRVADAPEQEMRAYGSHDFRRFVYTLEPLAKLFSTINAQKSSDFLG